VEIIWVYSVSIHSLRETVGVGGGLGVGFRNRQTFIERHWTSIDGVFPLFV
jgi:hypothetical protein